MQTAVELFLDVTKGFDNQEKQEAYDTLQENIEKMYEGFRKTNGEQNEEKLSEYINAAYRKLILSREFTTVDEYLQAWGEFQDQFFSDNSSFKKFEVWCNFSRTKIADG